jgi:hypothetical protein
MRDERDGRDGQEPTCDVRSSTFWKHPTSDPGIPPTGRAVQLRSVLCSRLLPFTLVALFSPVARASLICIRIHDTAHTPGVAGVGLTVAVHKTNAEVHEPRVGGILGTRRRRPITGRLDVVKGMA